MASEPEQKLIQMRDHLLEYPELYLNIYISEKGDEAAFAPMFARAWCSSVPDPFDADLVVFTGGPDVNPDHYGAKLHPMTKWDKGRDNTDMQLYADCVLGGIPMLGICRGAQFLHVMNGGVLFQHVDGHIGDHHMSDVRERTTISRISSTHHQMVKRNNRMQVLGTSCQSKIRWTDADVKEEGYHDDVEAFFYQDTCCLGIQGHPEYAGYTQFTVWVLQRIYEFICEGPNVYVEGGKYRLKQSVSLDDDDKLLIR